MKILSVYDGMACGMIAMKNAGVNVESYDAYEIDKFAIKTAQHNFPEIKEHGDVFEADFSQHLGADFLIGGSPCTKWSIARTDGRETKAEGIGWDLFCQYIRALEESKPKFFIYENNKSMSKAIRDSIRKAFGFNEICIDSALVSGQHRERFYWVGKRNEDGTYSKVDVSKPEDLGILLQDIALPAESIPESAWYDCGFVPTGKARGHIADVNISGNQALKRVYSLDYKSPTLTTCGGGHRQAKVMQNGRPRKLLPEEYKRLQTVPDWYDFSCVSDAQEYKMLGNGWTCDVITHLIKSCLEES